MDRGEVPGEPVDGESGDDGHTHESSCLNCGSALVGDYCHACGQQAHVHRTLGAFFHDLLHGVLHVEGKIWRTLPMLAWRPGELTREYIEGQRARFVSPVALFLFSVFLMFVIFSSLGGPVSMGGDPSDFTNSGAAINKALESERADLKELQQERQEALQNGRPAEAAAIARNIEETAEGIQALETFVATGSVDRSDFIGGKTGWKSFDAGIKKLNDNPALAAYKIQNNAYKFSWALIPISVPFVWLLFLHRRRYRAYGPYDHTVFVTYSITFMGMWLIVLALLKLIPETGLLRTAMIVIPPVHMYWQLRGAYQLSRWSAIWRTAALFVFALVALILFFLLLLALGIIA